MIVIPLEKKKPYVFGGHEKFVFRQDWLKKGVDLVAIQPDVFTQPDALIRLGVGKNMVRSIRHWGLAMDILENYPDAPKTWLRATTLGNLLFQDDGWDPYLEDMGTLWLLHWQLVTGQHYSLVWHYVFTTFPGREFTKQRLVELIERQFEHENIRITPGMVEREIDVCLRTYIPAPVKGKQLFEDSLDCPLTELGLNPCHRGRKTFFLCRRP